MKSEKRERIRLGANDLIALERTELPAAKWFEQMCAQWKKRTCDDPVGIAIEVQRIEKRRDFWWKLPLYGVSFYTVFYLIIIAVVYNWVRDYPDALRAYWLSHTMIPGFAILPAGILFSYYRLCVWSNRLEPYLSRNSFAGDLSYFFNASGTRPEDYDTNGGFEDLWLRAREILV